MRKAVSAAKSRPRKQGPPIPKTLRGVGEQFGLTFYADQIRVLEAMNEPGARVAWKACHGAGKTLIQGVVEVGFPIIHPEGQVIDTAPTYKQVKGQVWKEVHRLLARSSAVKYPKPNRTEWWPVEKTKAFRRAVGMTADDESHFQGEHGVILFNVNEAQAVGDHIFRAIDNNRAAGDIRELRVGNATTTEGAYYESFTNERHLWTCITTTAWDTPNLAGLDEESLLAMPLDKGGPLDDNAWPTVTRRWVREKIDLWGVDHPLYRIKVMAEFPDQDEWQLIAASWLDLAEEDMEPEDYRDELVVAAIDPAGSGGDECSGHAMRGDQVIGAKHTVAEDARPEMLRWLSDMGGPSSKGGTVAEVRVETAGLGHYMAKFVKDQGYRVVEIHPQDATTDPKRFKDMKSEMAWRARERFQTGKIHGLTDPVTQKQLAGMRWGLTPKGEIQAESKAARKLRGLRDSPDRGESLIMVAGTPGTRARSLFGPGGLNEAPGRRDDGGMYKPPLYDLTRYAGSW